MHSHPSLSLLDSEATTCTATSYPGGIVQQCYGSWSAERQRSLPRCSLPPFLSLTGKAAPPGLKGQNEAGEPRQLWGWRDVADLSGLLAQKLCTIELGALDLFLLHQERLEKRTSYGRTKHPRSKEYILGLSQCQECFISCCYNGNVTRKSTGVFSMAIFFSCSAEPLFLTLFFFF